MTTATNTIAAAELLARCWREGTKIDALPESLKPTTPEAGYAIQAALAEASGDSVVGWKIAATAEAGQKHIGVDGPIAGRLLRARVHHVANGAVASIVFTGNEMRMAEAEFAFVLAHDLPARNERYSQEEVMQAVASLHPALEFPDSRLTRFETAGEAALAADNACAHEFVLGDATEVDWRSVDLSQHTTRLIRNGTVATTGSGADVLGDPRIALTWLANNHQRQGSALSAGDIITTGVCGLPIEVDASDEFTADLGLFGRTSARLI